MGFLCFQLTRRENTQSWRPKNPLVLSTSVTLDYKSLSKINLKRHWAREECQKWRSWIAEQYILSQFSALHTVCAKGGMFLSALTRGRAWGIRHKKYTSLYLWAREGGSTLMYHTPSAVKNLFGACACKHHTFHAFVCLYRAPNEPNIAYNREGIATSEKQKEKTKTTH